MSEEPQTPRNPDPPVPAGTGRAAAIEAVERALQEAEADFERPAENRFVVALPGTRKLSTACSLLLGDHTMSVNAFVVRSADENHEGVFRWLLERNAKLAGMRGEARRHAALFGWEHTARRTLEVYEEAIAERWHSQRPVGSLA